MSTSIMSNSKEINLEEYQADYDLEAQDEQYLPNNQEQKEKCKCKNHGRKPKKYWGITIFTVTIPTLAMLQLYLVSFNNIM